MRTECLKHFTEQFAYPAEARDSLLRDYAAVCGDEAENARLEACIAAYEADGPFDYDAALETTKSIAGAVGVSPYAVDLLLFIFLSAHLRERYRQRGVADEIWRDSMLDLRYKLVECHDVYGVWGSFVASWFAGFFTLGRFALGRLQFEQIALGYDFAQNGVSLRKGDRVLNVHIPSSGPLLPELCLDAYRRAYAFYPELCRGGILPIACSSWMLYPAHFSFLPPESRIRTFLSDFHIVSSSVLEDFSYGWRIFGADADKAPCDLPERTSLQRAYKRFLCGGGRPGCGEGLLLFDGEACV